MTVLYLPFLRGSILITGNVLCDIGSSGKVSVQLNQFSKMLLES